MDLVKIDKHEIGGEEINAVDGKHLWEFLGSKRHYFDWIKDRIEKFQFIENIDFTSLTQNCVKPLGGRPATQYILSLDTAKEIAMLENNDKGREVRRYFIEFEKNGRAVAKPMSTLDSIIEMCQQMKVQGESLNLLSSRLENVEEAQARTDTAENYFTITGFANLNGYRSIDLNLGTSLGKRATRLCHERGYQIHSTPDPRWGRLNTYPKEILEIVFLNGR